MSGQNEEPGQQKKRTARAWFIFALKLIGFLILALLIVAGIVLGTCMYMLGQRGLR